MNNPKTYTYKIGGRDLTLRFGDLAFQAHGAVRAQYGDTVVLATAVMGEPREGMEYFPLTVDYEEKMYAAGRIKGSRFIKREGRPTDEAVLTSRLIDRTIRPLFDQSIRQDVQVITNVLAFDQVNDPDIISLCAASAAIAVSSIPWDGPVAGVRVARIGGKLIVNPTYEEIKQCEFEMTLSGKKHLTNMIEAAAKEAKEQDMAEAMALAEKEAAGLVDFISTIAAEIGQPKRRLSPRASAMPADMAAAIEKFAAERAEAVIYNPDNLEAKDKQRQYHQDLKAFVIERFGAEMFGPAQDLSHEIFDGIFKKNVLESKRRPDGRQASELRPLASQVAVLPRVHGTGLFQRGMTQALSIVTLGAPGDEQLLDGMELQGKTRFMHHYNFPPFCSGETKPLRGPGRREIGHGALAEKALKPMIPGEEEFPYTIRLVTEILSSNGSTSMAAACASSLALMDAGVPIKKPVAGIAMGLAYADEAHYTILTDIQGPEDHSGDMDFKVAGTRDGVTALQLDTKVPGLPLKVLIQTLSEARAARLKILDVMAGALAAPRSELSANAPRVISFLIDPKKIRSVIGSGGEVINKIIAETGAKIDIEDDGRVFITGENAEAGERARKMVETIVRPLTPGERFDGKVVSILNFGAFVEIAPGRQGLVHVSELADGYVKQVEDVVKVGDVIPVVVTDIDPMGRLNLSRRQALGEGGVRPRVSHRAPRGPLSRHER